MCEKSTKYQLETTSFSKHNEPQCSSNNLNDKEKLNKHNIGSQGYQKLISFYKENGSIPRFVMFPCTDCAEYFTDAISRQVHMMQKHAHLFFTCEVCSKLFATNSEKTRHVNSTHRKLFYINDTDYSIKYPCKVCEVEFDSYKQLVAHSPCSQGKSQRSASAKAENIAKHNHNKNYTFGSRNKRLKRDTEDVVLVQDADKFISFDFLNNCDKQERQEQMTDDKDVISDVDYDEDASWSTSEGKQTLTDSDFIPSVDSDESGDSCDSCLVRRAKNEQDRSPSSVFQTDVTKCFSSDQLPVFNGDRSPSSVFQTDVTKCFSSDQLPVFNDDRCSSRSKCNVDSLSQSKYDNTPLPSSQTDSIDCSSGSVLQINNTTCSSSSVVLYNNDIDQDNDLDEETLESSPCSEFDQNLSDCELGMDMEGCEPGKSYHFTEGGESWTISRNLDHDDTELNVDTPPRSDTPQIDMNDPELQVTEACLKEVNTDTSIRYYSAAESVNALSTNYATDADASLSVDGLHSGAPAASADSLATSVSENVLDVTSSITTAVTDNEFLDDKRAVLSGYNTSDAVYIDVCSTESNEMSSNARTVVSSNKTCSDINTTMSSNEIFSDTSAVVSSKEVCSNTNSLMLINKTCLDTNAAVLTSETSTDASTAVLPSEVFCNSSCATAANDKCTDNSVVMSTNENFPDSTATEGFTTFDSVDGVVKVENTVKDLHGEVKVQNSVTDLDGVIKVQNTVMDLDGVVKVQESVSDFEYCSWCEQVFASSQLKQHISDCHSFSMQESATDEAGITHEAGMAEDLEPMDAVESSCEVCDLCNEKFETFSQMKYHILSSHAASGELDDSSGTAGLNRVNDFAHSVVLQDTSASESVHEATDTSQVGFTEGHEFSVKVESFSTNEYDMEAGDFNSVNNFVMDNEMVKLEPKSDLDLETADIKFNKDGIGSNVSLEPKSDLDLETADTKFNKNGIGSNVSLDVEENPRKKRKCSKTTYTEVKSEGLECHESVLKNSVSAEDCVTESRRYRTRQCTSGKTLNKDYSTKEKTSARGKRLDRDAASKLQDNRTQYDVNSSQSTERCIDDPNHVLSCDKSDCVFPPTSGQQMHMEKHHSVPAVTPVTIVKTGRDIPFQCGQCYLAFDDERSLNAHTQVMHNKRYKYYPCDVCEKLFSYPGLKRRHMISIHNKESSDSRQVVVTFNSIQSSSSINSNDDFSSCPEVKPQDASVTDKVYVPSSFSSQFVSLDASSCSMSDSASVSITNELTPTLTDTAPDSADTATSSADTTPDDGSHILQSGQSPSSKVDAEASNVWSNNCKDSSPDKTTIKSNETDNTGTFPCKFCEKQFITLIELANHAINVHRSAKIPSYSAHFPCKFCGMKFSSARVLGKHATKMHSKDMPRAQNPCDCGKMFSSTSGLYLHLRQTCRLYGKPVKRNPMNTQKDAKVFQCQFCDHWFLNAVHLNNHAHKSHPDVNVQDRPPNPGTSLRSQTKAPDLSGLPPLRCYCGETFYTVIQLERHQRKHNQKKKRKKKLRKSSGKKKEKEKQST